MEFVDRIEEMARLKAALQKATPSFVAKTAENRSGAGNERIDKTE